MCVAGGAQRRPESVDRLPRRWRLHQGHRRLRVRPLLAVFFLYPLVLGLNDGPMSVARLPRRWLLYHGHRRDSARYLRCFLSVDFNKDDDHL